MNLKEAFRYQNKLQALMDEAEVILNRRSNITKTKTISFYSKVVEGVKDVTIENEPTTDYAEKITELTGFLLWLLDQHDALMKSIRVAKDKLSIDMDAEVSLNKRRQKIASVFQNMTQQRSSETMVPNGGKGYRFNAEGNQVSYYCDVQTVTTINYDRDKVRKSLAKLNKKIDEASAELDRCLVNGEVDYNAPFDVNESFADIFESYAGSKAE